MLLAVVVAQAAVAEDMFGAGPHGPTFATYAYDARVAWINAGELSLNMTRDADYYEFAGYFQTSREMSAYYTWNGVFAGVGRWARSGPRGEAYLARSESKDNDLKIVVMSQNGTRLLDEPDGEFETLAKPAGNDLISALFLTPVCYDGGIVHDGEDEYAITLAAEKTRKLKNPEQYYRGAVTDCEYEVRDRKDRKRRLIVSLGDVLGTRVAVQVRAKIPILPDPVFRLKVPPVASAGQLAAVD